MYVYLTNLTLQRQLSLTAAKLKPHIDGKKAERKVRSAKQIIYILLILRYNGSLASPLPSLSLTYFLRLLRLALC
jgi:hypothetical protein